MKASEVLERTLAQLEQDGWCQNFYLDPNGARCLGGALVEVTREPNLWSSYDAAQRYINPLIQEDGEEFTTIPRWNDAPFRTYEEVKRLLNRARENALADEAALAEN